MAAKDGLPLIIKVVYKKSTVNIILNGERVKQDKHANFYHFLSIYNWKFWPEQFVKKKKQKASRLERSKILSVHRWHNPICRKILKILPKKPLVELINKLSIISGYKI